MKLEFNRHTNWLRQCHNESLWTLSTLHWSTPVRQHFISFKSNQHTSRHQLSIHFRNHMGSRFLALSFASNEISWRFNRKYLAKLAESTFCIANISSVSIFVWPRCSFISVFISCISIGTNGKFAHRAWTFRGRRNELTNRTNRIKRGCEETRRST